MSVTGPGLGLEEEVLPGKVVLIGYKDAFSVHSKAESVVGNFSEGILIPYKLTRKPGLCCK